MTAPAIRIIDLTKRYGSVIGIEHLFLEVAAGEVFGFLGSNGAGKTTTIRTLLDLLRPTSGSATVLGFDCQRQSLDVRRRIGYLPGEMPFYSELTGAAYLKFLAALGPPVRPERVAFLLQRFDMSDRDLGRRMRDYSHGMKRKLGIVQAMMTDAPVLILDEPTSGLDPLMIEAFAETIDELARQTGTTVFLSSHVLSEVDRTCQRIGVVRAGTLVSIQTLSELRASAPRRVTVIFVQPIGLTLTPPPGVDIVHRDAERWVMDVRGPIGALVSSLAAHHVADMAVESFTLEETILRLFDERAS